MSLMVRTPVTGMVLHRGAKLIKSGLGFLIDSGLTAAPLVKIDLAEPGSQRRSEITTRGSVLGVEMLADLHPAAHQRWSGKISDRQPPDVAILREHQRSWRLMILSNTRIEDHHPALALPAGHPDDITRLQDRQRLKGLGAAVRPPLPRGRRLQTGKLSPQIRIRPKVPEVTGRRGPVGLNGLCVSLKRARQADH